MQSEEEIRQVVDGLNDWLANGLDESEGELIGWGDTFKHGFVIGKIVALRWALGEGDAHAVAAQYDHEDWLATMDDDPDSPPQRHPAM